MEKVVFESLIYSGILYLAYMTLFRRLSFFGLNRLLLLATPLLSLLIPALAPQFSAPFPAAAVGLTLPEAQLQWGNPEVTTGQAFWHWPTAVYLLGLGLFLLLLFSGTLRAYRLVRRAQLWRDQIYLSESATGPFAFFGKIIIPSQLRDSTEVESIIHHEKTHVAKGHTYDNSFYSLLCSLLWFNPFYHLLFKELKQVHECQADEQALGNSDRESYARLLLSSALGGEISSLAASPFFNSSLIKTRITMLYKAKTNKKMKSLYLALVPVILIMSIWSCQKGETQNETPASDKSKIIGFAEADRPPLFDNCDVNATKEEQLGCFEQGVLQHVSNQFQYPAKLKEEGMAGNIYVSFVVTKAGEISDAEVVRGLPAETEAQEQAVRALDEEALSVVNSLPRLSPAIVNGKKTAVSFTLPLRIQLK